MKSIEERANKFALEKYPYSPFYEEYTKLYIEIATEQKKIDIDKACEWLLKNVLDYVDHQYQGHIENYNEWLNEEGFEKDFRKAMEEEI